MKQKNQVIVLVVLVVIAAIIWSFEWRKDTPTILTANFIQDYKPLGEDNPSIRWAELERAQKTDYKSNGRNPFSMIAPPSPADIKRAEEAKNTPQQPLIPTPPPPPDHSVLPANLKYFGYGVVPMGSARRAFFTDGDDVYIVAEGDTLLGRYRILKVGNTNLEFQEISNGLHGTTPLDEQAAPSAPSA